MQKAIASAATMAIAVAQCGCGGSRGMSACCGLGSCTIQCAVIDIKKTQPGKQQDLIPREAALKKCTRSVTKMQEKLVKRTRSVLLPKLKKVRKIIIQRRLITPTKYRSKTVAVRAMVPFLEQRNTSNEFFDAVVDVPRRMDEVTEMVDTKKTVTVTEMQKVHSMELQTEMVSQIVPEKKWALFERTAKFLPEGMLNDAEFVKQAAIINKIPAATDEGTDTSTEPETITPLVQPETVDPDTIAPVTPVVGPEIPDKDDDDCEEKCSTNWTPPCIAEARKNRDPTPWTIDQDVQIKQSFAVPKFQDVAVTRLVPVDTIQPVTVTKEITIKVPRIIEGIETTKEVNMSIQVEVRKPAGPLVEVATPGVSLGNHIPIYAYSGNQAPSEVFHEEVIQEPVYEYEDIKVPVWVNVVQNEPTNEEYEVMIEVPISTNVVDEACMWQLGH